MTLTGEELSDARSHMESEILGQTCTILSVARASDGMGGFTQTDGTVATGVTCRLGVDLRRGQAAQQAGRVVYSDALFLDVANDQTLAAGHRVVVGEQTYEVVWVEDGVQWQMLKSSHVRVIE